MYQRILVTDDDPILRSLYKTMLKHTGGFLQIDFASSKKEALERVKASGYDFALLDIDLGESDEDGFFILQAIKARYDDTKVMMMSSMNPAKVEKRCLSLGAEGFTEKNENFIGKLRKWITLEVAEHDFERRHNA